MTTSQSTTFSPSSRSTTRSTPCVLGCCGPMLSTSSLVSNIAPRTVSGCTLLNVGFLPRLPELQPVERVLHQQLARAFERIVLALRTSLPVLGHQDAPSIGMADEADAEHVVDLALEPVGGGPHRRHRCERRVLADLHLHAHAVSMPRGVEA